MAGRSAGAARDHSPTRSRLRPRGLRRALPQVLGADDIAGERVELRDEIGALVLAQRAVELDVDVAIDGCERIER